MKKKNIVVVLGDPTLSDIVKIGGKFNPEDIKTVDILKESLGSLGDYNFTYLDNHNNLLKKLKSISNNKNLGKDIVDYVLNFCDEGLHNNPLKEKSIPKSLEKYGLPYTGAGPECLNLCYNKSAVKEFVSRMGIPVTKGLKFGRRNKHINLDYINSKLEFPLFVKPNYSDGSFAINNFSVVKNYDGLLKQIEWVKEKLIKTEHKPVVLVEEYLPGDELSVAIIGNHPEFDVRITQENLDVLTKGQRFIDYKAKWYSNSKKFQKLDSIKPRISEELQNIIINYSTSLFEILKCRDYARFDWRLDKEGKPKLMEANPNCGWCYDGHLVKAFSLGNEGSLEKNYSSVLEKILHAAEKRLKI